MYVHGTSIKSIHLCNHCPSCLRDWGCLQPSHEGVQRIGLVILPDAGAGAVDVQLRMKKYKGEAKPTGEKRGEGQISSGTEVQ